MTLTTKTRENAEISPARPSRVSTRQILRKDDIDSAVIIVVLMHHSVLFERKYVWMKFLNRTSPSSPKQTTATALMARFQ